MIFITVLLFAASQASAARHSSGADDHSGHAHSGHGHSEHAMGPAGAPKAAAGHSKGVKAGGEHAGHGTTMAASTTQMCHWTYGKCTISKPYLAQRLGVPETWGMCTGKNVEGASHSEGWDCASDPAMDKAIMGCEDRRILHVVAAGTPQRHAHMMNACMPGQVPAQRASAQRYWDAHDDLYVCLQDMAKTAAQCLDVTAASFMAQLEVIGEVPPAGMKAAIMLGLEQCDAATDKVSCAAVQPAADTEAAIAQAAQQKQAAPTSQAPGVPSGPAPENAPSNAVATSVALVAVAASFAALM